MIPTRRLLPVLALLLLPLLSGRAGDDAEAKAAQALKKLGGEVNGVSIGAGDAPRAISSP